MPLPKNPQERQKAARAVVALMKLTPAQRREVLAKELKKRNLSA